MTPEEASNLAQAIFKSGMSVSGSADVKLMGQQVAHLLTFAGVEHGKRAASWLVQNKEWLTVAAVKEAMERTAPAPKRPEYVALPAPTPKAQPSTEDRKAFVAKMRERYNRPARSGRGAYTRPMAEIEADLEKQRERVRALTAEQKAYFAGLRAEAGRVK